jgi:hypothetical protein
MRSALSLTLVLIAAMSGHSAGACEPSRHPLRLLLSSGYSQAFEQPAGGDLSFSLDLPACTADELRTAAPSFSYIELSAFPASRSYECAAVGAVPSRGP